MKRQLRRFKSYEEALIAELKDGEVVAIGQDICAYDEEAHDFATGIIWLGSDAYRPITPEEYEQGLDPWWQACSSCR